MDNVRRKHLSFRKTRIKMLVSDQVAETCDACDRTEELRVLRFLYTQIFIAIEKALKPIKPFLNYEEQIRNLIARKGMIIVDREFTASKLKDISYFALIDGYKNLFYNPMSQKRFLTITQLKLIKKSIANFYDCIDSDSPYLYIIAVGTTYQVLGNN